MDNMINVIRITTKGEITVEYVKNDLEDIGKVIGTDMVEVVRPAISIEIGILPEDVRILCDEDACFKNSKHNSIATVLYSGGINLRDFIVGTVVLCKYDKSGISSLPDDYIEFISCSLKCIKERLTELGVLEI